jgi:hypothetical protein
MHDMATVEVDVSSTIAASEDTVNDMPSATLQPLQSASPFLLRVEDVQTLAQSDGFAILREHLAEHYTYEYVPSPSH